MNASLSLGYLLANIPHKERKGLTRQFSVTDGELYDAMTRPERLREIFGSMTANQKRLLGRFLTTTGRTMKPLSKTRTGDLEPFLDQPGILFTADSFFRQELIPLDYYPVLVPLAFDLPPAAFASGHTSPRQAGGMGAWDVLEPLFELLRYAYHQPLELTNDGSLYKRHVNKILKNLPAGASREIDVLWQFSLWMGLSAISADRRVAVSERADKFWARPVLELLSTYLQFVTYSGAFFPWAFFALAANLEPEQWLDPEAVLQWLRPVRSGMHYDVWEITHYFDSMKGGGVWETNGRLGRLTPPFYALLRHELTVAQRPASLIIEPTGDILVPPDACWSDRWSLAKMAGLVKNDRMAVYHVDKQAVREALVHGELPETYITQLARMSQTGLPANVETNIRDWYRQFGRHQLLQATIIHSNDPVESLQVGQILQSFVRKRLSERDIIVDGQDLDKILKKLDAAGQPVVPTVQHFDSSPKGPHSDDDFFADDEEEFWEDEELFDDTPVDVHVGRGLPQ